MLLSLQVFGTPFNFSLTRASGTCLTTEQTLSKAYQTTYWEICHRPAFASYDGPTHKPTQQQELGLSNLYTTFKITVKFFYQLDW